MAKDVLRPSTPGGINSGNGGGGVAGQYINNGGPALVRSRSSSGEKALETIDLNANEQNNGNNSGKSKNDNNDKERRNNIVTYFQCMSSMRMFVLMVLCFQNSMFTVLRRYSQGVLKEVYSKHEVLLVGEIVKIVYSAFMISKSFPKNNDGQTLMQRLQYLTKTSGKMFILALIYGAMNILSFVALRNISAGMFTIFAQCKILTTASFSTIILRRKYSWTKWRSLIGLLLGVLLFSEPIWGDPENHKAHDDARPTLGTIAVLTEVTLSGFASIYFEKVIKTDPLQLNIWERNFQLALGSFPVYFAFIALNGGGKVGYGGGWSWIAVFLSLLGAAGGLLVALSIKYGDSILKTLATTGAIILSSVLDHIFLGGPLTAVMVIAAGQVIIAICDYTFDATPSLSMPSSPTDASNDTTPKPSAVPRSPSKQELIDDELMDGKKVSV